MKTGGHKQLGSDMITEGKTGTAEKHSHLRAKRVVPLLSNPEVPVSWNRIPSCVTSGPPSGNALPRQHPGLLQAVILRPFSAGFVYCGDLWELGGSGEGLPRWRSG